MTPNLLPGNGGTERIDERVERQSRCYVEAVSDDPERFESPSFRRARSPEHKAQRQQQILDAARRLGLAKGVRHVSLGDLGGAVGLTKSNVLRYFETRETIYLQLSVVG